MPRKKKWPATVEMDGKEWIVYSEPDEDYKYIKAYYTDEELKEQRRKIADQKAEDRCSGKMGCDCERCTWGYSMNRQSRCSCTCR